jgi:hypothetical protein
VASTARGLNLMRPEVIHVINTVTGFGLEIGFIDHFNTRLVTALDYSAFADLPTLEITRAHAKPFQSAVFISRFLVTASNSGHSSTAPNKSSLHRLPYNSFWTFAPTVLLINISTRTPQNTPSIVVLQLFLWERVCLRRRYPVTATYTCLL